MAGFRRVLNHGLACSDYLGLDETIFFFDERNLSKGMTPTKFDEVIVEQGAPLQFSISIKNVGIRR